MRSGGRDVVIHTARFGAEAKTFLTLCRHTANPAPASGFLCTETGFQLLHVDDDLAAVHDNLFVKPLLGITPFQSFICRYPSFIHVELEEAQTAVIAVVSSISAEA